MFLPPKRTILRIGYRTNVGRIRDHNEDNFSWFDPGDTAETLGEKGWLFVVADGMGGHAAGEVASKIAVTVIVQRYQEGRSPIASALKDAVQAANEEIFQHNRSGAQTGMGTTIVCAAIHGDELFIAHVGDSRAYLLRKRALVLLTRDHTLVNDLLRGNAISPEEAEVHPRRHVLSRALGKKAEADPEVQEPSRIFNGDVVLLCTDGISGYLNDEQIAFDLESNSSDPQTAATALTQHADGIGGEDNATAIVIFVDKVVPIR